MKTVDTEALHNRFKATHPEPSDTHWEEWHNSEPERYKKAIKCKHFACDTISAPCLWHISFCLHPNNLNPETTGFYQHCKLVWHGKCDFNEIT